MLLRLVLLTFTSLLIASTTLPYSPFNPLQVMKFNALYSFGIISIYCHPLLAMPLLRRVTPTFKVLASGTPAAGTTPTRGKDNLCTAEQIAAIKAGFAEARALALAAESRLTPADAEKSEGVTTWVGTCM